MDARDRGPEDEVSFQEGAELRVLRGTIVSEDAQFIHLVRDDGDWSIAKSKVVKVHRSRGIR